MKEIPLTHGHVAVVDDEDYERLAAFKWSLKVDRKRPRRTMYARRTVVMPDGKQRTVLMHVEILNPPEGKHVDHINGDGLDNRRENLRLATNAQNHHNIGPTKANTSGFKGVTRIKSSGHFTARLTHEGATYCLGNYLTAEDAAKAYDAKARELYGEYARLNFPNEEKVVTRIVNKQSSRFRGVGYSKGKWEARIRVGQEIVYLGRFETEEEAARAYDKEARATHGQKARLNFP